MTATEAPNGAYCYVIEAADNGSGVFSTVGDILPALYFITAADFATGTISSDTMTSITGTKYGVVNSASTLEAGDTGVFVATASATY